MPPSKQEIEAHARRYAALRRQADGLDDDAVRRIFAILRDTRQRIAARIASEEGFELLFLQRLQAAVEQAFEEFRIRALVELETIKIDAINFGTSMIDDPLIAAGAQIAVSALPMRIDPIVLQKQLQRGTFFIKDLSERAAATINAEILMGLQGEKTPNAVMQEIGQSIRRGKFRTIALRAETITRTEFASALNQGTLARVEQAGRQIPGMRKYWLHAGDISNPHARGEHIRVWRATAPSLGGTPIPVNRKFNVGGFRAAGPHDGSLPAKHVINCRCRLATTIVEAETGPMQQRLFA